MARLDMDEGAPGPGRARAQRSREDCRPHCFLLGRGLRVSLPLMIAFAVLSAIASLAESGVYALETPLQRLETG